MNQNNDETIEFKPTELGLIVADILHELMKRGIGANIIFPDNALFELQAFNRRVYAKLANRDPNVYQVGSIEPDETRVINVINSELASNQVCNAVVEELLRAYALDGIDIARVVSGNN